MNPGAQRPKNVANTWATVTLPDVWRTAKLAEPRAAHP
nr:hypothetical protein [Kibdelosporangium sp. MJ126-NF4]CTQ91378.1 hypothetical protein [Kibdelosporangium sp. MJ126-NF4]